MASLKIKAQNLKLSFSFLLPSLIVCLCQCFSVLTIFNRSKMMDEQQPTMKTRWQMWLFSQYPFQGSLTQEDKNLEEELKISSLQCIQNQPLLLLLAFQVLFYNLSLIVETILPVFQNKKGPSGIYDCFTEFSGW